MSKLNVYANHKGLPADRFDSGMTNGLHTRLTELGYEVNTILEGNMVYHNDGQSFAPHASISIIENPDTGRFHVSDFGDVCTWTFPFIPFRNLAGITCGQYNPYRADIEWPEEYKHKRHLMRAGYLPELYWQYGAINRQEIRRYRSAITLERPVYYLATYDIGRESINILSKKYPNDSRIYLAGKTCGWIPFEQYIMEICKYKIALGASMLLGQDINPRDILNFGFGIPVIRPTYRVFNHDPLIPNYHYIAVETELEPSLLTPTNNEQTADDIMKRYYEVIDDNELLEFVSQNAMEWYDRNMRYPNVVDNLIKIAKVEEL